MKAVFKSNCIKVFILVFTLSIYGGSLVAQDLDQQPQQPMEPQQPVEPQEPQQPQQPQLPQQPQQTDFSDEQIDLFVSAVVKVLPVQQEIEQEMIKKIEDNGMELDQYNQIATQVQTSGNAEGVAEDDLKKFEEISGELQNIQMENQDELTKIIRDEGLDPQLYQEMMLAYSSNPAVKQKVDEKLSQQQ